MLADSPYSRLPDPALQPEFYRDVPAKRLVAWVIDTVIVALLTALAVPFTAFLALLFLPLLFMAVNFLYRWATLSARSATWGMRFVALEFRRLDGRGFDPVTAFAHTLVYTVSIAMVLPQLVSVVMMATGTRAQGLGDRLLGTVALNQSGRH